MCDFWDTVLHLPGRYRRDPFQVRASFHDKTPLTAAPLSRWVALWTADVRKRHVGAKADLRQAGRQSESRRRSTAASTAAAPTSPTA